MLLWSLALVGFKHDWVLEDWAWSKFIVHPFVGEPYKVAVSRADRI